MKDISKEPFEVAEVAYSLNIKKEGSYWGKVGKAMKGGEPIFMKSITRVGLV